MPVRASWGLNFQYINATTLLTVFMPITEVNLCHAGLINNQLKKDQSIGMILHLIKPNHASLFSKPHDSFGQV
jgi:hypothetical protein